MNRTVRAAGFAAAAVALVAGASYSEPAIAVESRPEAAQAAEAAAPEAGIFSKLWTSVSSIVAAPASATTAAPERKSLSELVAAYNETRIDDREQECLANAVYFEARGESIEGQLAVAEVVLNRAASGRYPTDLCGVITQPWQFSFIRNGRFPKADRTSESWRKAVAIAEIARKQIVDSLPSDVLWYHATYVSPSWGKRLTRQSQIGLHIFYS
jgi:spore germination cell wall hydrolase CwlJ-like protein